MMKVYLHLSRLWEMTHPFPFTLLQMSGCGGKSLSIPASFQWNAQEVYKLGKSRIYILAEKKLQIEDVKVLLHTRKWLWIFNHTDHLAWFIKSVPMSVYDD